MALDIGKLIIDSFTITCVVLLCTVIVESVWHKCYHKIIVVEHLSLVQCEGYFIES